MHISQIIQIVAPVTGVICSWLGVRRTDCDAGYEPLPIYDPGRLFGPYVFSGDGDLALRVCTYRGPNGGYLYEVHDDISNEIVAADGPVMFREVAYDLGTELLIEYLPKTDDNPVDACLDVHTDPTPWNKFYGPMAGHPGYPPTPEQLELCWARVANQNEVR